MTDTLKRVAATLADHGQREAATEVADISLLIKAARVWSHPKTANDEKELYASGKRKIHIDVLTTPKQNVPQRDSGWSMDIKGARWLELPPVILDELQAMVKYLPKVLSKSQRTFEKGELEVIKIAVWFERLELDLLNPTGQKMHGGKAGTGQPLIASWDRWSQDWWKARPADLVKAIWLSHLRHSTPMPKLVR